MSVHGGAIEGPPVVLYRTAISARGMVHMGMRGFPKITAAAIVGVSAGVAAALVAPAGAQGLPDGKGKELVSSTCQACHDLSPITGSGGFSRSDWEMVVQSMIDMGATIRPEDVTVIVNYLAASFPPKGKQ